MDSSSGMKLPGFLLILVLYLFLYSVIFWSWITCSNLVFRYETCFYNASSLVVLVFYDFSSNSILYLVSISLILTYLSLSLALSALFSSVKLVNSSYFYLCYSRAKLCGRWALSIVIFELLLFWFRLEGRSFYNYKAGLMYIWVFLLSAFSFIFLSLLLCTYYLIEVSSWKFFSFYFYFFFVRSILLGGS